MADLNSRKDWHMKKAAPPTDRPIIELDVYSVIARVHGITRMQAKRWCFWSMYGIRGLQGVIDNMVQAAGKRFGVYMERLPWMKWWPPVKEALRGKGYNFPTTRPIEFPIGSFREEVFRRMQAMPSEVMIAQRLGQYVIDHHADSSVDEFFIGVQARIAWRCAMRVVRPLQETKP